MLPLIDGTGTYNFKLKTIERGWRIPTSRGKGQFPAVFIATTDETRQNGELGTHRGYLAKLQVVLVGYVLNSKTNPLADSSGVQLDLDKLIEDVTHALYADITQNGLCDWTDITGVGTDNGDLAPVGGCHITAVFGYHEDGNP